MRGLKDKGVLVTGGASGIGAATAARFLEEGARVCVLDRDQRGNEAIRKNLPALSGVLTADVSRLTDVRTAFAEAVRLLGRVDVLINNAGISIRHPFLDITPEEWDRVVGVDLTGVFYVAQTAARHMVERGGGVVLMTASTNGIVAHRHYADYNACKAGGYVLTPMQKAEYTDAMLEEVNRKIPLGRHATPEEIAGLFAYLASEDGAYFTGQVFIIDGGETAGGLASR